MPMYVLLLMSRTLIHYPHVTIFVLIGVSLKRYNQSLSFVCSLCPLFPSAHGIADQQLSLSVNLEHIWQAIKTSGHCIDPASKWIENMLGSLCFRDIVLYAMNLKKMEKRVSKKTQSETGQQQVNYTLGIWDCLLLI